MGCWTARLDGPSPLVPQPPSWAGWEVGLVSVGFAAINTFNNVKALRRVGWRGLGGLGLVGRDAGATSGGLGQSLADRDAGAPSGGFVAFGRAGGVIILRLGLVRKRDEG